MTWPTITRTWFYLLVTLALFGYVMPISNNNSGSAKKLNFNIRGKSATAHEEINERDNQFLTIAPALPILPGAPIPQKLAKRSYSSLSCTSNFNVEDAEVGGCDVVTLQHAGESRTVVATRSPEEREKNPDRICLDRRGLTTFPSIVGETKLRLMSLQHNLLTKIDGKHFSQLKKLVFLDLYDNQIEKVCNIDPLENLRVLLIGKNRIKKIEGLQKLCKLEVLDLHGNQIGQITGLENLASLKVLNLAGNNIKIIGQNDFQGLTSLKELNVRRNKIKKLLGFGETPQLQKLYLSNNDVQKIEDMNSLAKALQIREVSIDGNPVTLSPNCVSFLVAYLPNLQVLSTMQVSEQLRRAAAAWRTTKEQSSSAFLDLSTQVSVNVLREEVISNAKTNWELLRSQTKCLVGGTGKASNIKSDRIRGLNLQNSNKLDTVKLKSLDKAMCKGFGSLTSINENAEMKKILFKKRSNSSDNMFAGNDVCNVNPLEFKLPPILVPIINNLTENKGNAGIGNSKDRLLFIDGEESTTDSDLESSESHESLKSNLRNHLINSNNHFSGDKNGSVKNKTSEAHPSVRKFQNEGPNMMCFNKSSKVPANSSSPRRQPLSKNLKPFYDYEGRTDCQSSAVGSLSSFHSSSSKTSSVDSCKSFLSDSTGSLGLQATEDTTQLSESDKIKEKVQLKRVVHYKSNRAATARAKHRAVPPPSPPPQPPPPREREQGGDYLVEIVGRCLNVYGQGALRFIDRPWNTSKANDVNVVKFNYVQFNGVATVLNKLKHRFPNAEHFIFKETNISHLGQINALAEVQGLSSIRIEAEGNPIISKDWKMYAIFRLAHWGLKAINGKEITEQEIELANEEYSGLTDIVMWSLPESLLQPLLQRLHLEKAQKQNGEQITAKQFLFNCDPALRNVVAKEALQWRRGNVTQEDLIWRHKGKVHLSSLIDVTIDAIEKLQILEKEWPSILHEIVRDTLVDYTDMNAYMKRCISMLDMDK
ncbi:leucine-rich repeat-containing protein 49 [Orussus abietinus]|uniref:leucine-rich repeat-containing protein 49 n=1 Tax=Orussus abietinus TaxID=222816 RepID=UPI0006261E1A|nr:leucine-rich repeat-containing protein 49 [Orussus abietinus]